RLLAGTAEGLATIHQAGLVHRDLKPANVLLAQDGPRVIDFGIARAMDALSLTTTGVRIGTPAFMAPEQVTGDPVTVKTDVFALANLVAYAATGRSAFGDGPADALMFRITQGQPLLQDCPAELRPFLARCLARDPSGRPTLDEAVEFGRQLLHRDTV